jgi:hypothetical protein
MGMAEENEVDEEDTGALQRPSSHALIPHFSEE